VQLQARPPKQAGLPREVSVLWVLWLTYGSFHSCRNNLGVALPGIQADLGYTKAQLGTCVAPQESAIRLGQQLSI
jgi:sugar phosphate permease